MSILFASFALLALIWFVIEFREYIDFSRIHAGKKPNSDPLIGKIAAIIETEGGNRVLVDMSGETWNAEAQDGGTLEVGDSVQVVARDGLTLQVRRTDDDA